MTLVESTIYEAFYCVCIVWHYCKILPFPIYVLISMFHDMV
jgi:hypothetical protein